MRRKRTKTADYKGSVIKDSPAGLAECPCPGFREKRGDFPPSLGHFETQPSQAAGSGQCVNQHSSSSTGHTVPSSSLLIWPVQRALVCRWTVLVAGVLSLAVVGVRPGARNWFARAFSVDEDWQWGEAGTVMDVTLCSERCNPTLLPNSEVSLNSSTDCTSLTKPQLIGISQLSTCTWDHPRQVSGLRDSTYPCISQQRAGKDVGNVYFAFKKKFHAVPPFDKILIPYIYSGFHNENKILTTVILRCKIKVSKEPGKRWI